MFLLKKLVGALLMPLPFSLMLLILGLLLLWFSHRHSRKQLFGKLFVSLGTVVLLIASLPYTALVSGSSLERRYPPLFTQPVDLEYVIVLGGGHRSDPYLPPREQLGLTLYHRLMEGINLVQANPGATLLLSGYEGSDPVSDARLAGIVARQLGVADERIRLFESARDTAEEAALIAPVIKGHKSALVTSASHMPRAMRFFHAHGVSPVPSPTAYLVREPQSPLYFYQQLPQAGNLGTVTLVWREMLGSLWQKIRI
jgi:uncharacterized SAM-binding protein YcdF (DUF218 family)